MSDKTSNKNKQSIKTSDKLLNCPFCGGEATFWRLSEKTGNEYTDCVFVRCKDCYASTKKVEYNASIHKNDSEYNEVARLWNTRKSMERIVDDLEEAMERQWGYYNNAKSTGNIRQMDYSDGCAEGLTTAIEIVKEEEGIK